jgi:hypothetical protein
VAAGGDVVDELAVHVVDEGLEVGLLLGGHVAGGVAGVLELAGVDDDVLELGPAHEVAVVGPLHDDADGADDGGVVGVDLVAAAGDVVGAGGSDGLDRGDDLLVLLLADADDLVVDLLRGRGAAAGRVDVQDDGFDGGVVAELADLGVDLVGVEDDAVDVDDADLGGGRRGRRARSIAVEERTVAQIMVVMSRAMTAKEPPMIATQNQAERRGPAGRRRIRRTVGGEL